MFPNLEVHDREFLQARSACGSTEKTDKGKSDKRKTDKPCKVEEDGCGYIGFGIMDRETLLPAIVNNTWASLSVVKHDNPKDLTPFALRSIESLETLRALLRRRDDKGSQT